MSTKGHKREGKAFIFYKNSCLQQGSIRGRWARVLVEYGLYALVTPL